MPLIDIKCKSEPCAQIHEVMRPLAMWPQTPPCPECGSETEQIHLPPSVRWTPDPVVVFKGPDGQYRFPGDASGLTARSYERKGYDRVEIRGAAEMRRFEQHMNQHEYSRAQRKVEASHLQREAREKEMRSELRQRMQHMSERGRDLARAAMRRNDQRPSARASDANFHNQAYSFDHSNREESRDAQGRRRRD